jgi:superfamily II DNA/RNA helicase
MNVLRQFEGVGGNTLAFTYFIGGEKIESDLNRISLKGANVVVSTPGRLFDLIQNQALSFK